MMAASPRRSFDNCSPQAVCEMPAMVIKSFHMYCSLNISTLYAFHPKNRAKNYFEIGTFTWSFLRKDKYIYFNRNAENSSKMSTIARGMFAEWNIVLPIK